MKDRNSKNLICTFVSFIGTASAPSTDALYKIAACNTKVQGVD